MIFADIDEFWVASDMLNTDLNLESVIDSYFVKYKKAASLAVNWLMFGSSGNKTIPRGEVLENYKNCASDDFERNMMMKACVKPERVIGFKDPHLPLEALGYDTVNTDGDKVELPCHPLPNDRRIRIHHYFHKSFEDFEKKANKGFADRLDRYQMDIFEYYDRNECYNDLAWQLKKEYMKEDRDNAEYKQSF